MVRRARPRLEFIVEPYYARDYSPVFVIANTRNVTRNLWYRTRANAPCVLQLCASNGIEISRRSSFSDNYRRLSELACRYMAISPLIAHRILRETILRRNEIYSESRGPTNNKEKSFERNSKLVSPTTAHSRLLLLSGRSRRPALSARIRGECLVITRL